MKKLLDAFDRWISTPRSPYLVVFYLLATAGLLVFLVYLSSVVENQVELTPCSPSKYPANCYHVPEDICTIVWEKSEPRCQDYLKTLSLPAGRLSGPILFKCQLASFDHSFAASRKLTPECQDQFKELEEWKRRSNFK